MPQDMPFAPGQMEAAMFRLLLENNAFLRIVLANQVALSGQLGIDLPFPSNAFADLNPGQAVDEKDAVTHLIRLTDQIAELNHHRAWQWAQMHTNTGEGEAPP